MVHGTSTGGSVALQLAISHPELVQRMVLAAAACRLSPDGLRVMTEVARLIDEGDARRAAALLFEMLVPRPMTYAARGAGWVVGGRLAPDDPTDMLVTITAENAFDAEPDLDRVRAPTLVLGGTADRFYTEDLFRRTAAGIPQGRVVLFPGKPHGYPASAKLAVGIALGYLLGT
jgi:pimeloyl-ACP methyl ester carboxylesterase